MNAMTGCQWQTFTCGIKVIILSRCCCHSIFCYFNSFKKASLMHWYMSWDCNVEALYWHIWDPREASFELHQWYHPDQSQHINKTPSALDMISEHLMTHVKIYEMKHNKVHWIANICYLYAHGQDCWTRNNHKHLKIALQAIYMNRNKSFENYWNFLKSQNCKQVQPHL